ncbi:MAG: class I SAM-dependent methyltransferase [Bacteroidota bacterium]
MYNTIPTIERSCDNCGSSNMENLWEYSHKTRTMSKIWKFNVHNVICKECGFVFTSPALRQEYLMDYYEDSYSQFTEQQPDYSIQKRLSIIDKYFPNYTDCYIEIGANSKSQFHNQLNNKFKTVLSIEPNKSTASDYRNATEIEEEKADCLTHYFVLEHVPAINAFFKQCNNLLKPDGHMICEVPALSLYEKHIAPLILFEHVNHFTPKTLESIAAARGFEMIENSYTDCSRPFGFVSVFKKCNTTQKQNLNEFDINKKLFLNGLRAVEKFNVLINSCREIINNVLNKNIIIWAANETTSRLLNELELGNNISIIDSDIRKKNYFGNNPVVHRPDEVPDIIVNADVIIICTAFHAPEIIESIKVKYNKFFETESIFIIDLI